jgi:hypothetical protein
MSKVSPFHFHGYIGPQHEAAWAAMKWHNGIIEHVARDLDYNPPEYVLIRGPALSGKTTFAMQLMHRLAEERPDILTVYLPIGGANASHSRFLDVLREGLMFRLKEWLQKNEDAPDQHPDLRVALNSWASLKAESLTELLSAMLWQVPDEFGRVVFVVDDCERLPPGQRELVAEELRSIHAARGFGPLSRFSVIVLASSLLRYPGVVSPLADVVLEYRLEDLTPEETQQFLERCGSILGGLTFEAEGVQYLHHKTAGQAVFIQRICSSAIRKHTGPAAVEKANILDGICECFEDGGGFIDRLLNVEGLSPETKATLDRMLRGHDVLPFEFDPAVGQLMDLGLARIGTKRHCACRSPLLLELLEYRYRVAQDRPRLTSSEARLLDLPQVVPLLCDDPLFDEICATHPSNHVGFTSAEPGTHLQVLIEKRWPEIDIAGIQHCIRRYLGDQEAAPTREEVLRTVAKLYLYWCRHEH